MGFFPGPDVIIANPFKEIFLNLYILVGLILFGFIVWTAGAYSFWKIGQKRRGQMALGAATPALRLADQWIAEAQKKIEDLIQRAEQPLSAAQNELLELRLEASRLPQGVKSLRLVRESLLNQARPTQLKKNVAEIARLYLAPVDFKVGEQGIVFFLTSLGEMPCLEVEEGPGPLTEAQMKALLPQVNQILSDAEGKGMAGGFLYFGNDRDYQACLANEDWMKGLKSRNVMVLDFKGLTAILVALRLSGDAGKVLRVFEKGVQSTNALLGQSDDMGAALSILSSNSLKTRTVLDGTPPDRLKIPTP